MNADEAIKGLAEEARRIGHQHAEQVGAWDRTVTAQSDLLQAIVDVVRPALAAVCSRVERSHRAGIMEAMDWKGLRLGGGLRDGWAIYINEHGTLVEVQYTLGSEPRSWQGSWSPMTAKQVAAEYQIPTLIESLTSALVEQANGSAPARTSALQAAAARMEAVTLLLRGAR